MTWLTLLFVTLFAGIVVSQNTASIPKLFEGEWSLQITKSILTEKNTDEPPVDEEDLIVLLNVTNKDNVHTATFEDWTNERTLKLTVEWDTFTSGELKYSELIPVLTDSEEEDDSNSNSPYDLPSEELLSLFLFQFVNRSNGYFLSQGPFQGVRGKDVGVYQFLFTSHMAFVFTVWSNSQTVVTVTGTKIVPTQDVPFWQRFSMPMVLVALWIGMRFLQPQRGGPTPTQRQRQVTTTAPESEGEVEAIREGEEVSKPEETTKNEKRNKKGNKPKKE